VTARPDRQPKENDMDKELAFTELAKVLGRAKEAEAEGSADLAGHMYDYAKRIVDALNAPTQTKKTKAA
jgi:hypothetical protein